MKKLLLLTSLCLASLQSFATDLFVRENGAGGAFPTISEAITAAVDGDRIIIEPKPGDIPYFEDIIIDKSLTLLSSEIGVRYIIQGTISLPEVNGRIITIQNADVREDILSTGANELSERMIVTISNSSLINVTLVGTISSIILNNDITSEIDITHGKIIGNSLRKLTIVSEEGSSSLATDRIYIIANTITQNVNDRALRVATNEYALDIYNNTIVKDGGTANTLLITNSLVNSNNYIHNNIIISNGDTPLSISGSSNSNWDIRNNYFESGFATTIQGLGTNVVIQAFFNSILNRPFTTEGVAAEASNFTSETDSDLIDAGHPGDEFLDIDLTRNDVGVNGGSFSQLNYATPNPETLPQIFFVDIPRRITTGTTIDVQAIGVSKQ